MKYKLSEIGKIVGGGTPSSKHEEYFTSNGIPWLTPKDLSNYTGMYISRGARDITEEGLKKSSAKLLPAKSILVSSRAPIGYVAIANNAISTNQGFKSIVPNTDVVIPEYLYFVMKKSKVALEQVSSGSTFKEVSTKVMTNFEVDIPSIDVQRKILKYLMPISQKIELNKRINDNLDELSTAVFENWIQNTSSDITCPLDCIAKYTNGLPMQKFRPRNNEKGLPVVKIRELNQGNTDGNSDQCSSNIDQSVKVNTGDIIFSWSGTLALDIWSGDTAGLNQHLFKVTSSKYPDWFIFEWTKYYLKTFQNIAKSKATTMGHIKRSDLHNAIVKIPTQNEMTELNAILQPIFSQKVIIRQENRVLIQLKEELLFKYF